MLLKTKLASIFGFEDALRITLEAALYPVNMYKMIFKVDVFMLLILFVLATGFIPLRAWHKNFENPYLSFASLNDWPSERRDRLNYAHWPNRLIWIALISLSLAFINPRILISHEKNGDIDKEQQLYTPAEGIAIYLVLDQSGSMKEEVPVTISGQMKWMSKADLLKTVTKQFIQGNSELHFQGRRDDLIGLIFFARAARVMVPLTLDHRTLLQWLERFHSVTNRDEDGTSIGYAVYKAANLISATRHYAQDLIEKGEPVYTIKNAVIVLITDGMQDPNPLDKGKRFRNMDVSEAAAYARKEGVRLYIINVEPKLATEEFAPHRHLMQQAAESTQGKFYTVDSTGNLAAIMGDIDQIEKSRLGEQEAINEDLRPDLYQRISLFPFFLIFGLFSIFLSCLLETTVLRKVP